MTYSNISQKELSAVKIIDLQQYFINNNWKIIDKTSKEIIFKSPNDEENNHLIFKLPKSDTYNNYLRSTNDVINMFSHLKNTSKYSIYGDILNTSKDIMRLRIINPGKFKYSIPLDVAATNINAIKNLYIYSASSEVKNLPHFEKPMNEGLNHVNNCQFGHTFEGSFGFTIDTPIINEDLLFEELKIAPFERKVSERLIIGLNSVKEARKKCDPQYIVKNYKKGLNARMCESLIELSNKSSTAINFNIIWGKAIKPCNEIENISNIRLDSIDFELLIDACKELKKVEPYEDIIIGKVVTLHSNEDPNCNDDFPRIITMKHEVDHHLTDIKLNLNKENYLLAYRAHGSGKRVIVKGKLFRTGNSWKMNDISSMEYAH